MSSILINGGDDQLKLTNGGCDLSGPDYSLISGDLREFEAAVLPKLLEEGFSPDIPTLFLSECVMIYIEPDKSDSIVQWAAQAMKAPAMFLTFEQILPDDRFGQVMIDNLKANMGVRCERYIM